MKAADRASSPFPFREGRSGGKLRPVLRLFALLVSIAAILGLIGQEAAFAQIEFKPAQAETVQMDPDCAKAMGIKIQRTSGDQPCHGMTPECIAKMGCAIPLAVLPASLVADRDPASLQHLVRIKETALTGRSITPEPEPPALLG